MNETDFMKEYNAIFERSLIFAILSLRMGLLSLENLLDKKKYNQRDIFEYGMRLVIEGRVPETIEKILSNIINLETDKERKILKNIQKDAVLLIQEGRCLEEVLGILNSYVNIDLDKATEKCNEINDYISERLSNMPNINPDYYKSCKQFAEKIVNEFYKEEIYNENTR